MKLNKFKMLGVVAAGLLVSACAHDKKIPDYSEVKDSSAPTLSSEVLTAPVWTKGDSWTYSDGYGLEVSKVYENGSAKIERTDVNGVWTIRKAFFKEQSKSPKHSRQVVYRSNDPMVIVGGGVGKGVAFEREFTKDSDLMRHSTSWVIEGRDKITVPAGTFETWVLVMRSNSVDSGWRGYERWWYSPAVNNYVRMEYQYGSNEASSRVLMAYNPAK